MCLEIQRAFPGDDRLNQHCVNLFCKGLNVHSFIYPLALIQKSQVCSHCFQAITRISENAEQRFSGQGYQVLRKAPGYIISQTHKQWQETEAAEHILKAAGVSE